MSAILAALVVGGAVLVPGLLDKKAAAAAPTAGDAPVPAGVTSDRTAERTAGHIAACASLASRSILGVPDAGLNDTRAGKRFAQIKNALLPSHGAASANTPGFPKLSAGETAELLGAFLDAVRAGAAVEGGGYLVALRVKGGVTGVGGDEDPDRQVEALADILDGAAVFGLRACGVVDLLSLGKACCAVAQQQQRAVISIGIEGPFDAVPALKECSELAALMDQIGIPLFGDLPGFGDLVDSFADATRNLPDTLSTVGGKVTGAITDVLGGAVGDIVGSIVTSTPVLLGVAAFVVWKVSK